MKILFTCTSLAPGRNGVGDYTTRLANECRHLGNSTAVLSLNEPASESLTSSDTVLKLSGTFSWRQRVRLARDFVEAVNPDFVSLQYVPFGFSPKGLPWKLAGRLRRIAPGKQRHVMMHELWVGIGHKNTLKTTLYGWLQRHITLRLIRQLHPLVVHSHAATYVEALRQANIPCEQLKLFSNIEVSSRHDFTWLCERLKEASVDPLDLGREQLFVACLFGSIHPEWPGSSLIEQITEGAVGQDRAPVLILAGNPGPHGKRIWDELNARHPGVVYLDLGMLQPEKISDVLMYSDVGLATSPWYLIEKSGSAMAMMTHGLPVVVAREELGAADLLPNNWSPGPGVFRLSEVSPRQICNLVKLPPHDRLPDVARQLIADLGIPEKRE